MFPQGYLIIKDFPSWSYDLAAPKCPLIPRQTSTTVGDAQVPVTQAAPAGSVNSGAHAHNPATMPCKIFSLL